jgi:hypothetical protein
MGVCFTECLVQFLHDATYSALQAQISLAEGDCPDFDTMVSLVPGKLIAAIYPLISFDISQNKKSLNGGIFHMQIALVSVCRLECYNDHSLQNVFQSSIVSLR